MSEKTWTFGGFDELCCVSPWYDDDDADDMMTVHL